MTEAAADTLVAVCIATYRRPDALRDLLDRLNRQDPVLGAEVVIVVADNDPAGSAQKAISSYVPGRALRSVRVDRPGIAAARNACLELARDADWLAFIDDDERPHPAWLRELMTTAVSFDADLVTGPVLAALPPDAPRWATRGGWFDRRRMPTGTEVTWAATNNMLLRRTALDRLVVAGFDEEFGISGGSDLELTTRLREAGARMVWCDDALVDEDVPAERVAFTWLVRRALRVGNVGGRLARRHGGPGAALVEAFTSVARTGYRLLRCMAHRKLPGQAELWPAMTAPGYVLAAAGILVSEYRKPFLRRERTFADRRRRGVR